LNFYKLKVIFQDGHTELATMEGPARAASSSITRIGLGSKVKAGAIFASYFFPTAVTLSKASSKERTAQGKNRAKLVFRKLFFYCS
jgi:hypothetical protein